MSPPRVGDPVSFVAGLRDHGRRIAVLHRGGELSYAALADQVDQLAARLGAVRRLVLLAARNDLETLVRYLACLTAGHPVLVTAAGDGGDLAGLTASYDPDVVLGAGANDEAGDGLVERRAGTRHDLHPDLALLLSTSGTTGSSKLVRLSRRNLSANAGAIAGYLAIAEGDRAATSLPLHYCYGLSVVNSHLLQGAGLILTDLSVVDRCFWDAFRAGAGTTFPAVPYTFDLLDRVGFEQMSLPTLRYVTQAGGRLAPDRVRRYAQLGQRRGWDLVVMYGQTEATARMAYLPPDRAMTHPGAIGVPIPGGSFRLVPLDDSGGDRAAGADADVGELVYQGPNVMLGYAHEPADLAREATVHELATGDIARRTPDGLYEIVGRRSRFLKIVGLRVDLDQVERTLADHGVEALCTGSDHGLVVAVAGGDVATDVRQVIQRLTGLPPGRVDVVAVPQLARLGNGKPDYPAVMRLAAARRTGTPSGPPTRAWPTDPLARLRALFAEVLQTDQVGDESTFVSLGGDSLSYVELSVRLEAEIGVLPSGWHTTALRDLAAQRRRRTPVASVETNVILRAVAIALVVGNHTGVFHLPGGAHVLVGVAGFNFARFALRSDHRARAIARIAVPSMCWIGLVALLSDDFTVAHALLVNGQAGGLDARWAYWFVEALVQILVGLGLVLAVPAVRRWEQRHPAVAATLVLLAGLAVHYDALGLAPDDHRTYRPDALLWLFAVGWLATLATGAPARLALSALLVAAVPGLWDDAGREATLLAGMLLLVWVPRLPCLRPMARLAAPLAATSLYVYLTHWQVYPLLLDHGPPAVAWLGSLGVGVVVGTCAQRLVARVEGAVDWPGRLADAGCRGPRPR